MSAERVVPTMSTKTDYQYLEARPSSNYQQLWVKGRHMRAEVLYRLTVGPTPRSLEEIAQDFDLPIRAVEEAVDYCQQNQEHLHSERAREDATMKRLGLDQPPYVPVEDIKDS